VNDEAASTDDEGRPGPVQRFVVNAVAVLALVAAAGVHYGALRSLRVSSINMAPTLVTDDRVVVRNWGSEPGRGDVVVYRSPFGGELLVSRIVGIGGDVLELDGEGLRVADRPVAEPSDCAEPEARRAGGGSCQVPPPCDSEHCLVEAEVLGGHRYVTRKAGALASLHFPKRRVPDGHVFVLNDNRIDERDSRIYGSIPRDAVVGIASFVYYASDETGIRWDRMSRRVS
jgi:signal peptidase I